MSTLETKFTGDSSGFEAASGRVASAAEKDMLRAQRAFNTLVKEARNLASGVREVGKDAGGIKRQCVWQRVRALQREAAGSGCRSRALKRSVSKSDVGRFGINAGAG